MENKNLENSKKIEVVSYTTCEEYKKYLESGKADDDASLKHNPVPKDAMSLSEFGMMSDEKIISCINEMAKNQHKSDLRVMYSNGYGFKWTDMQTIAKSRGYINTNPGTRQPHYVLDHERLIESPVSRSFEPIHIQHGRRDVEMVTRKYTFTKELVDLMDDFFNSGNKALGNIEKSKILEQILFDRFQELINAKEQGEVTVIYDPVEEEIVL